MGMQNQIIAVEKGIKGRAHAVSSELYKLLQKQKLFDGHSRVYKPKNDEDESFPNDNAHVQYKVPEVLDEIAAALGEHFDIAARKDWTNTKARADVVVEGKTLLCDVPVTYLLFLEKQITDMRAFIATLPVLDSAEAWKHDDNDGLYKTEPTQTVKTKKVEEPLVLYAHTSEHPAQCAMVSKDVTIGHWNTVKHSGAIRGTARALMVRRVDALLQAVKSARELANSCEEVALDTSVGKTLFSFLYEPLKTK